MSKRRAWLPGPVVADGAPASGGWRAVPLAAMAAWQYVSGVPALAYYFEASPHDRGFSYHLSAALTAPGPLLHNASHLPFFAGLAWLWCWSLAPAYRLPVRLVLAAGITGAFAVINELTQLFVPYRYATLPDILLNLTGAALGVTLYLAFARRRSSSASAGRPIAQCGGAG